MPRRKPQVLINDLDLRVGLRFYLYRDNHERTIIALERGLGCDYVVYEYKKRGERVVRAKTLREFAAANPTVEGRFCMRDCRPGEVVVFQEDARRYLVLPSSLVIELSDDETTLTGLLVSRPASTPVEIVGHIEVCHA